jgi:hypothetical protein
MRAISPMAVAAVLLAGCVNGLEPASNVRDLRVLAMRSDPPDAVLQDMQSLFIPNYHVQALIYDPPQGHRTIRYSYSTCPKPASLRCEGQTGEIRLDQGTVQGGIAAGTLGPATLAQLQQFAQFLQDAVAADTYHGFGGLPLYMALHACAVPVGMDEKDVPDVTACVGRGGDQVWSAKRVVLWLPIPKPVPGLEPNQNPPAPDVLVNGVLAMDGDRPVVRNNTLFDVYAPDPASKESYVVPNFDGTVRELTETWDYFWFTTKGHFTAEQTGGYNAILQAEFGTDTRIAFEPGDLPGDFEVIVVVHDGRGGESWTIRQATYPGVGF